MYPPSGTTQSGVAPSSPALRAVNSRRTASRADCTRNRSVGVDAMLAVSTITLFVPSGPDAPHVSPADDPTPPQASSSDASLATSLPPHPWAAVMYPVPLPTVQLSRSVVVDDVTIAATTTAAPRASHPHTWRMANTSSGQTRVSSPTAHRARTRDCRFGRQCLFFCDVQLCVPHGFGCDTGSQVATLCRSQSVNAGRPLNHSGPQRAREVTASV